MNKTLQDFEQQYPPRADLKPGAEIVRIAPSPTGMPHIGTAMQAIINKAFAIKSGGKFILRIEDTDQARTVPGATEAIIEALRWLGVSPDEGPFYQSQRLDLYKTAADQLVKSGHAYHCFCSEARLQELREKQTLAKVMPKYDGKCRSLSPAEVTQRHAAGEKSVIRMLVPSDAGKIIFHDLVRGNIEFDASVLDDSVLLKSDGWPTYHLASVVDDHFMRVTMVVRGEEWISSAPKHVLLYRGFGWQAPKFLHTVLLRDAERRKLSKRRDDTSITWFREHGYLPQGFANFLTRIMWAHPGNKDIYDLQEFAAMVTPEALPSTGPIVDIKLLNFINSKYIAALSPKELYEIFLNYLREFKLHPALQQELMQNREYAEHVLSLEPERNQTLAEIVDNCGFFFDCMYQAPENTALKHIDHNHAAIVTILRAVKDASINSAEDWTALANKIAAECNVKNKVVFMLTRLALSGKEKTPPLYEVIAIMGKDRVHKRLEQVLHSLH